MQTRTQRALKTIKPTPSRRLNPHTTSTPSRTSHDPSNINTPNVHSNAYTAYFEDDQIHPEPASKPSHHIARSTPSRTSHDPSNINTARVHANTYTAYFEDDQSTPRAPARCARDRAIGTLARAMAVLALNTGLIPLAARAATRRTATKRVVAPKVRPRRDRRDDRARSRRTTR